MPYQDKKGRTCGFLDLETKEHSNHFMRRFFILDDKVRLLQYYMDNPQNLPDSSPPVGTFNMQYVSMVDNASWHRPKISFSFYINIGREKHYFKAGDDEDRDGWIRSLKDSSKVVVTQHSKSQEDMLGVCTQIIGGVAVHMPISNTSSGGSCSGGGSGGGGSGSGAAMEDSDISEDDIDGTVPMMLVPDSPYSRIPPVKVGYCTKQGALMKNWKRRYFKLDEDGLSYFKSARERAPIRTISWSDIHEARKSIGIHINKDHVFEVVTPTRVFYVKTESSECRDSWISAINSHHPQQSKKASKSQGDTLHHPTAGAVGNPLLRPHPEKRKTWGSAAPKPTKPEFNHRYTYSQSK